MLTNGDKPSPLQSISAIEVSVVTVLTIAAEVDWFTNNSIVKNSYRNDGVVIVRWSKNLGLA